MKNCLVRFRHCGGIGAFGTAIVLFSATLFADSFDWRNVNSINWNSPAKNQFAGTCWAHGPTSSLEAKYMLTRNDTSFVPDLSEQQLVWENEPDLGSTAGGGGFIPMLDYYKNHGVVADSVVPKYPDSTYWDAPPPGTPIHPADYASRCWRITSWAQLTDPSIENIKAMIRTNGPLVIGFNASDSYSTVAQLKANYTPQPNIDNHAVSLMGYYDDPTCPTGGYWVIKNSWGTGGGENGYYYVPYGSSIGGCGIDHLFAITGAAYYTGAMASATWKGGSNTWSSAGTNWTNDSGGATYSWENKETNATFNASTGTAITVSGKVIAHAMTISSGATGYTFSSGAPTNSCLTLTAGVTANESVTFNTPMYIGGPQTWNATTGKTITVNGPLHTIISDLTIAGAGNVVIAGAIDGGGAANIDGPGTSHGSAKPGGIIKASTGSLTFTGNSNYGGDVTVNTGTLTLNPSGDSTYSGAFFGSGTLNINSLGIVSIGGGASNFSGTINVQGGTLQFIPASGVTGVFSGSIAGGSNPIVQNGPGATRLTATNNYTGSTTISSGALQAKDGVGLPAASMLVLNGGVLQSEGSTAVTFTRSLNSTPGVNNRFYWNNGGGFSAGGANMTVRINGGTGSLTWGTNPGSEIVGTLRLSSSTAGAVTDFQNAINLNGDVRTVQVDDNPNSSADYAQISSSITGTGTSGVTKTGGGLLKLMGANSYTGTTTIAGGVLQAAIGSIGIPTNSFIALDGGVLQLNGSSFTRSLGPSGGSSFQWGLGGGGFSAGSSVLTVSVGGTTSPTPLVWGSTLADVGTKLVGPLTLNASTASYSLTFKNSIDLNGGSRSIYCGANTVYLQGGVSDSFGGGSLTKSGTATLYINGAGSSYTGATTILGGDLYLNTTSGYAIPGDLILGGKNSLNLYVQGNNQIAPTSKWTWKATGGYQEVQLLGHSQTVAGLADTTGSGVVENVWGSGYSPVTLTIDNATNCSFNGYLRNNASGSAGAVSLVKTGNGTQTLAGGNIRYGGGTTINGGKLIFQDITSSTFSARAVTNNSVLGLHAVNSDFTFSGVISGTGSVEIGGSRQVTLSGSGNTYGGTTRLKGGNLVLNKSYGYAIPGNISFDPAGNTYFLYLNRDNQIASTATATWSSGSGAWRVLQLQGHSQTLAGISSTIGTYSVIQNVQGETGMGNSTLIINNTTNCAYNGVIRNAYGGDGTLALVKSGTGTLTLTGTEVGQYTGGLTVTAGTLDYSGGTLPSCSYTINGGTLNLGGKSATIGAFQMAAGTLSGTGILTSNASFSIQGGTVSVRLGGSNIPLTKTGQDTAVLSGVNTYTGATTLSDGVLQANSGEGLPSGSYLKLDGGILQNNGSSGLSFTRTLSATAGSNRFEWTANGGGFAAGTAALNVRINGGTTAVDWSDAEGANIAGVLKLGSPTASSVVDFQNGINLNGKTRTVQVDDNPRTLLDAAKISGVIADGTGPGGLIKTGVGTLTLSGANTYTGATTISAGDLALGRGDAVALASTISVAADANLVLNSGTNYTFANTVSGAGGMLVKIPGTIAATATLTSDLSTFTGKITVDAKVRLSGLQNIASLGNNDVQVNSGGQFFDNGSTAYAAKSLSLAGTGWTTDAIDGPAGALRLGNGATYTGPITLAANAAISSSASATVSGDINGAYQLQILPVWTGRTQITLAGSNHFGSLLVSKQNGATAVVVAGSDAAFSSDPTGVSNPLTLDGGTVQFNGRQFSFANLSSTMQGGAIQNGGTSPATITLGANGTSPIYGGSLEDGGPAALALVKIGAGTMTLNGPLTYTGNTAVNDGILQINSSTATLTTITGSGILSVGPSTNLTATSIQVDTLSIGTNFTSAAVPEPSMLVLMLGAVLAGWMIRRQMR